MFQMAADKTGFNLIKNKTDRFQTQIHRTNPNLQDSSID